MPKDNSHILYNPISFVGGAIAGVSLAIFCLLFFLQLVGEQENPYYGLFLFIVVPAFLILGLLLVPVGAYVEVQRRKRRGIAAPSFPVIDLNDRRHRAYLFGAVLGVVIFLLLSAVGSYEAYHYTDSVDFCGRLCHEVMKPEDTLYRQSPHARVRCVDCHVGAGANWYVRSKLSGLYQVYATVANVYPRPIPTPIENLRPAQETCEQCHWPEQFYGAQQKLFHHFLPDEHNSEWQINMLIKTGGGSPRTGLATGIHWHMNIANRVEYLATDARRQEISWVRFTNKRTGETRVYVDSSSPVTPEEADTLKVRVMDCMDCHNRPTHIYRSPAQIVNLALATGRLKGDLPWIKRVATEALGQEYATTQGALDTIALTLREFYGSEYPELAKDGAVLDSAIATLQELFQLNFFPEMRARWDRYPDNVGHLYFKGCYRCHDGKHVDAEGRAITNECTACHTIVWQGRPDSLEISHTSEGLPFRHPVDVGTAWQEMGCSDCHAGMLP
ncbi:MAG: NapC/NirT family cytochrome c [candidate division KSB1 bacterium]|nr:NapC/NirT family cytochrome c [candidate division KSB1 bacterium]